MNIAATDVTAAVKKDMHLSFVKEYFLEDISVCDKLIELF